MSFLEWGSGSVCLLAWLKETWWPTPREAEMHEFLWPNGEAGPKEIGMLVWIVYDPFTNPLTLFPERDRKDVPFIKALRNPLLREMPPSLKSTVMAVSCTSGMLSRAARVKQTPSYSPGFQVPEVSGGTTTGRGKALSVESMLTVTILRDCLGIRIVCTPDIFGRN